MENRRADFGFTPTGLPKSNSTRRRAVLRSNAPGHAQQHPLARAAPCTPRDLRRYPLIQRAGRVPHDIYPGHPRAETTSPGQGLSSARFRGSIRRLIALGFGIGLIPAAPSAPPHVGFHERPMSRYFRSLAVYLIRRRGAFTAPAGEEFIELVRSELA